MTSARRTPPALTPPRPPPQVLCLSLRSRVLLPLLHPTPPPVLLTSAPPPLPASPALGGLFRADQGPARFTLANKEDLPRAARC